MSHAFTHPAAAPSDGAAPHRILLVGLLLALVVGALAVARWLPGPDAAGAGAADSAGTSRPAAASAQDSSVPDASGVFSGREFTPEEAAPTF